jgi:uncharacterized lipoprotein YmbA
VNRKTAVIAGSLAALTFGVTACSSDADVASQNLSKDADNFKINRRIVMFNGITDKYLMVIEGLCSINTDSVDSQLEVTCKVGPGEYKKHYLGLSDNVSYFVEQGEPAKVSVTQYKVIFKPSVILPDVDFK